MAQIRKVIGLKVLDYALEYLEKGWCQNELVLPHNLQGFYRGNSLDDFVEMESKICKVCFLGAITFGNFKLVALAPLEEKRTLRYELICPDNSVRIALLNLAEELLRKKGITDDPITWNDAEGRTQQEVLEFSRELKTILRENKNRYFY